MLTDRVVLALACLLGPGGADVWLEPVGGEDTIFDSIELSQAPREEIAFMNCSFQIAGGP